MKKLKDLLKEMHKITGYSNVHDDHEVSMAITDLRSIADRAAELADHYEKEGITDLEGWVQSKITKSADYINAVYDEHMYGTDSTSGCSTCGDEEEYEEEEEEDEEEEEEEDEEDVDEYSMTMMREGKSTCCGRCGHKHVKGTSCPKPYLTGKRHCRNRK